MANASACEMKRFQRGATEKGASVNAVCATKLAAVLNMIGENAPRASRTTPHV
jgi:hypothetical protein